MNITAAGVVNVCVANLYKAAGYQSEVVSQAVLNEPLECLEESQGFVRVKTKDEYSGWIDAEQLVKGTFHNKDLKMVRAHLLKLRQAPEPGSKPVNYAVIGCRLSCIDTKDGWYQVALPDNRTGWAKKEGFGSFPRFSEQAVISLAREFLGYPYFWGGKTPNGLDCSGFVQLVFGLLGKSLPRDSWMQEIQGSRRINRIEDAGPGDLLFFGKTKPVVTHVAISLGRSRIIHCQGMVKENSLKESDRYCHAELKQNFICGKQIHRN